jgi:hypothetical protein
VHTAKEAKAGMHLQETIDVAAYDPTETSKIVASTLQALDTKKSRATDTNALLEGFFTLQEIQIAQNKLIIRMLTEIEQRERRK